MSNLNNNSEVKKWEITEFYKTQVYVWEGCLCTLKKDKDDCYHRIILSNFIVKGLYFIKSDERSYRIFQITNVKDKKVIITSDTDLLVSSGEANKLFEKQGNFLFKGTNQHLALLKAIIYEQEKPANEITTLGQHATANIFTFCNGIFHEGRFYKANEFGIVDIAHSSYYIPYASRIHELDSNQEESKEYESVSRFKYVVSSITIQQWANQFIKVFGENGKVALIYAIASIFRDIIFKHAGFFPNIFAFGPPGVGKSTLLDCLLFLFGIPQPRVSLGGASTVKALMRKMGQFRNILVFFDEYKNSIDSKLREAIKNMYDGMGYENAAFSTDSRTKPHPILSSPVIAGQELPTADPAFLTRCILLFFLEKKFDNAALIDLKNMQSEGLSNVLTQILAIRPDMERHFQYKFRHMLEWLNEKHPTYPDRLLKNYAVLLAVALIAFQNLEDISMDLKDFKELVSKFVVNQNASMNSTDDVQRFFDTVQFLYTQNKISDSGDIAFNKDGTIVYLYMHSIHPLYQEALRRQGSSGLEKETLLTYIKADKELFKKHDNARFAIFCPILQTVKYVQRTCLHLRVAVLKEKYKISLGKESAAGEEEKEEES